MKPTQAHAEKIVSRLLGEDEDTTTLGATDVLRNAGADTANLGALEFDEERTEIVIAKELLDLNDNLRGTDGPEAAEEAADRVEALAHELLVMHGAEEEVDDAATSDLPPGEVPVSGEEGGSVGA